MRSRAASQANQERIAERVAHVPILLLDDVSSELDRRRNQLLFDVLTRLGGQVFLTMTHQSSSSWRINEET